jgi:hypothetical protein
LKTSTCVEFSLLLISNKKCNCVNSNIYIYINLL